MVVDRRRVIGIDTSDNRATNVPIMIHHAAGQTQLIVNQRDKPSIGNGLQKLGTHSFVSDKPAIVEIGTAGTDGYRRLSMGGRS
jgi:hypothetical protein